MSTNFLLKEDGDRLLLEDGDRLLLWVAILVRMKLMVMQKARMKFLVKGG